MNKKEQKGIGQYQKGKAGKAILSILYILQDGAWHRYGELRGKTGMSSATLSKHLKELRQFIQKKVDVKSEYPYPVHYRLTEGAAFLFKQLGDVQIISSRLKPTLLERKDPMFALEYLNTCHNVTLLNHLTMIKAHVLDEDDIQGVFELQTLPYEALYVDFLTATKEIIDSIDLDQLTKAQMEKLHGLNEQMKKGTA